LANNVLKDIVPKLNAMKLPKGYYYKLSGEAESEGDAFGGGFITVIILTVFLFIAVLILQFKTVQGYPNSIICYSFGSRWWCNYAVLVR